MEDACESSSKPVEDTCGLPAPMRMHGHIVNVHLFVIVNVVDLAPN